MGCMGHDTKKHYMNMIQHGQLSATANTAQPWCHVWAVTPARNAGSGTTRNTGSDTTRLIGWHGLTHPGPQPTRIYTLHLSQTLISLPPFPTAKRHPPPYLSHARLP